jgi:hypothetical protein
MKRTIIVFFLSVLISGCVSMPVSLGTPPNQVEGKDYQILGEGEGSSVGIMLFNFIPINQNERFQRAYEEAILSKGGDGLLNPVIKERWFWAWILNGYIFEVKGTVIKRSN